VYERIKAYAPYENVKAQAYPAMLVMAGYNDSRVQYWEAAKWVAVAHAQDRHNLLLLKTEMRRAWRDERAVPGVEGCGPGICVRRLASWVSFERAGRVAPLSRHKAAPTGWTAPKVGRFGCKALYSTGSAVDISLMRSWL
jgi:hypothetical protein